LAVRLKALPGATLHFRPCFEAVEDRTLLSTFLVSTSADSGPGSLRQAILDSNAATSGSTNTIDFAIPGTGVQTIAPVSALPAVTASALIDGTSQPGYTSTPLIELDGSQAGYGADGLLITSSDVTIRGLDINSFSQGAGIHVTGPAATNNWSYGNFLGTDPTGTQAMPNDEGVEIDSGSVYNLVGTNGDGINDASERNLISGNLFAGVWITGQGTSGNAVAGNWIGTDISGEVALDNGTQPVTDYLTNVFGGGIAISAGASGNRIGTDGKSIDDVGERNVIAGSDNDGIDIYGYGTESNVVAGNFIGTDVAGVRGLGLYGDGVYLSEGASSNWIGVNPNGGSAADEGNVISGSTAYDGVQIASSADNNVVAGNKIGTDFTGRHALGNYNNGVEIDSGCVANTIGGATPGSGNVISANGGDGVGIGGSGTASNVVQGNWIGTDSSGTVALGNSDNGVEIDSGADWNTIGGTTSGSGNVISANGTPLGELLLGSSCGVLINGIGATNNVVQGNMIGTDAAGTARLGNVLAGVEIENGAASNTIGGSTFGAGNVMSANGTYGVLIYGTGTTSNVVQGSWIGTDRSGTVALGNSGSGVDIGDGADWNTIGGATAEAGNLITNNGQGPITNNVFGLAFAVGVQVADDLHIPVGDQITSNRIFGNFGQPIELGYAEVEQVLPNSAFPRTGPNNFQNYPIVANTGTGQFQGWISGASPNTVYCIDVFASAAFRPTGAGEAEDYLGSVEATTDGQGQVTFAVPYTPPPGLPVLTATATDANGNTSEVSGVRQAGVQTPTHYVRTISGASVVFSSGAGNGIALEDPNAGPLDPLWSLELSVSSGTLILSATAGLTGSGDGTGTLSYSGSLSAVDAALESMTYTPPAAPHVLSTLTVEAQSEGATPLRAQVGISDGILFVTNTADSGAGSLRQAILDANSLAGGLATVDFAIPGEGVQTIQLASPLPPIAATVLIDGTSQPGFAGTPLIAIGGEFQGSSSPLVVSSGDVTIRGLALDRVAIDPTANAALIAVVQAPAQTPELSLLDSSGAVLVQGSAVSVADPDNVIDQGLAGADYSLALGTTGHRTFTLTITLEPASPGIQTVSVGKFPANVITGDFNGDGKLDLAAAVGGSNQVSVSMGNGDGTFQPAVEYAVGENPSGIAAGDFNGDGKLDLAVTNTGSDDISVLLNSGDGTFQTPVQYPAGDDPVGIVAGGFTGDERLDLAVLDSQGLQVLLGNGDGTFQPPETVIAGVGGSLVAADFTGNGRTDLAVSGGAGVQVLLSNGDGTFRLPEIVAGPGGALVAVHFTGNGRTDLAVSDGAGVQVVSSNGDGTFQPAETVAAGVGGALVAGDFTGNGRTDLAVVNGDGALLVFLANSDGTFQPQATYTVGQYAHPIVAGDFTGSGRSDLAVENERDGTLSVLLANGDGTFEVQQPLVAGSAPSSIVAGDFTGNGRTDLAVVNGVSNTVSVLLGDGDGTFQSGAQYAVGDGPVGIVAGDFNNDGRTDLAVSNGASSDISVLLGNGDGTFQPQVTYAVGAGVLGFPSAIVAGDFTGNGRTDLAVLNEFGNTVSVLLGNGDGTFQPQVSYPVGVGLDGIPFAIVAGDFSGNGRSDLAVAVGEANLYVASTGGVVCVLLGNGDGTFQPEVHYAVSGYPDAIVKGDFNGDGRTDLAVQDGPDQTVSVLLGNGDGTFHPQVTYAYGVLDVGGDAIAAGNFSGNGRTDLAIKDADGIQVLFDNGDGTFQPAVTVAPGNFRTLVAGDFTGNGRTDLAATNLYSDDVSILLSTGDGKFLAPGQLATTPSATPLVADVTRDGTKDILVVDGSGEILYRQGIPGQPGTFGPPVTVNPALADGSNPYPSRDIAWLPNTDQGPVLASVDAGDNGVTLYAYRDGSFVRLSGSLPTGELPAQIIAADLSGTGMTDLVVRNAGDGTLSVYFGTPFIPGSFSGPVEPELAPPDFFPPMSLSVGIGVSDVQAVDTTGDGRLDLVVTNKVTGQVSVLLNLGDDQFASPIPYRAGTGLSAIDPSSTPEVTSLEETAGVAAGPLTPGGSTDFVTVNNGSDSIDVLAGLGNGEFASPVTIASESGAQVIRMADFSGNGTEDLAVLTGDGLSVYLGNGQGRFLPPTTYAVPAEADGLTVADLFGNGKLDLLVGDAYGDVLVLVGNGDGTFDPFHEATQAVELAVADLTGNGSKDIIYADQGLDRVVVDYGAGNSAVLGNQSTGLLAPGAVALADLTGNGIPDLIVANSGSNNVLIYPGLGNGQFGPAVNGGHGYFVGTNPVGITVADLTGDLPDLVVADKGSNDVSILVNEGGFRFNNGPRLNAGGYGPVSTVVEYLPGNPYPDLLVTNSQSNNVALLPGAGGPFFKASTQTFPVGTDPGPTFVGNFNGALDLVTVNAGSNDLTLISNFLSDDSVTRTIPSDGIAPDTAFSFETASGFEDLVVGNEGDGVLALFEGSPAGLNLSSTESLPDLPSPSALVYAGLAGGQVQFYAANEGREAAILVTLSLGGELGPVGTSFALTTAPSLVPLQENSLQLVGTLLVVAFEPSANEANLGFAETEVATSASVSSAVGLGQSTLAQNPFGAPLGDMVDQPAKPPGDDPPFKLPAAPAWQRFLLGTDEAIERFHREHPGLSAPSSDQAPAANPSAGRSDLQAPAQRLQDVRPGQSTSLREQAPTQTIDKAIDQLDRDDIHGLEMSASRRMDKIHRSIDETRIGPVGFTHATIRVDAGRARETRRKLDEMCISATELTRAAVSVECSQGTRYDISAALALAATVARGIYVPSPDRRTRIRARLPKISMRAASRSLNGLLDL
jgi:hypothetical protein